MEKVYLQLYSVREGLADFDGALKKISDMGYAGVEFAGATGGMSAKALLSRLRELNLDPIGAHVGLRDAEEQLPFFAELGARYMICPMESVADYDDAMRLAESLNRIGVECAKSGLKYGYHNHTQEFMEVHGRTVLEHLIANTDPASVVFELDVGWITTAGLDPVKFINAHAGRFDLIHAKEAGKTIGVEPPMDFSKVTFDADGKPVIPPEIMKVLEEKMKMNVPQGKGIVDWKAVKAAADKQGARAYIVEREWDYLGDIFKCVSEDLAYMRTV